MLIPQLITRFLAYAEQRRIWHRRRLSGTAKHLRVFAAHVVSAEQLAARAPGSRGADPTHEADGRPVRAIAELEAADLVRQDLGDFLWRLAHSRVRGNKPISITTVGEYRKDVIQLYAWASEDLEVVEDLLVESLRRAKVPELTRTPARAPRRVDGVPDSVIRQVLERAQAKVRRWQPKTAKERADRRAWARFKLALEILWYTGMRREELCGLSPADLRYDRKLDQTVYAPRQHKTAHHGDQRRVIFNDSAEAALWAAYELVEEQDRGQGSFPWVPVFRTWSSGDSFYRFFVKALKEFGLPHYTPHQVRHSFATKAAAVNVEGARVQLGHKDVRTTMRYVDNDAATAADVVRHLDGGLSPSPNEGEGPGGDEGSGEGLFAT